MNQQIDPTSFATGEMAQGPALEALRVAAAAAAEAIPPAWPLASSVAVNPFLGQASLGLAETASLLGAVAGANILPNRADFAEKISAGEITLEDVETALARLQATSGLPMTAEALVEAAQRPTTKITPLPTVAELAAQTSTKDVPALVLDRISAVASSYFDGGQATWGITAPSLYAAWRDWAAVDRVPEIAGATGVRSYFDAAPTTSEAALHQATSTLKLTAAELPLYFHRLLMSVGGWAQFARGEEWRASQKGTNGGMLVDLLTIRAMWDAAVLATGPESLQEAWAEARTRFSSHPEVSEDVRIDAVLQEAAEIANRRDLASKLTEAPEAHVHTRPELQAAFCIDVRSEVFRRALEMQDHGIETLGFAGFFGLAVEHIPFGADTAEARCPVLLSPGQTVHAEGKEEDVAAERLRLRSSSAFSGFKSAATGAFAFVETLGLAHLPKIIADSLGAKGGVTCHRDHQHAPAFTHSLSLEQKTDMAEAVLRAMSLTDGFAPVVLLLGHGASAVNNPHAAALDCGACGGHSGEVNARLLADVLNDPDVRTGLKAKGLSVPEDTVFVAGLHDTTTDEVTLYDPPSSPELAQAHVWLKGAGTITRAERAARIPGSQGEALPERGADWAQVRPEWALAGCSAFIAAPRRMTTGRDLGGRAFLHSYEWEADADQGYATLELILTAPVVVASWISLQYFGSTTAPETFGGGNKLLHNVVGGLGVLEGNGGDLRPGLPWQSVHDGEKTMHDPLRLTVAIAAPAEAITSVLEKHPDLRALFDNGWLSLHTLNASGQIDQRYIGDLSWEPSKGRVAAAA